MPLIKFLKPVVDVFGRHEAGTVAFADEQRFHLLVVELKAAEEVKPDKEAAKASEPPSIPRKPRARRKKNA